MKVLPLEVLLAVLAPVGLPPFIAYTQTAGQSWDYLGRLRHNQHGGGGGVGVNPARGKTWYASLVFKPHVRLIVEAFRILPLRSVRGGVSAGEKQETQISRGLLNRIVLNGC